MPVTDKTQHLYVKSFFAASIPEAMKQARQELGPDALLLNAREAPPEARSLGEFEVVFGGGPAPAVTEVPGPAPVMGVDDLRQQMDQIRALLSRMTPSPGSLAHGAVVEQALVEVGVEPSLAREIDDSVRLRMSKRSVVEFPRPRTIPDWDREALMIETAEEILSRFEVSPEIGRVTALVGPPGAGKTSALVKIAVAHGLALGRAVRFISIDTERIGAAQQLQTYAAILSVPFQAVESTAALAQAIDSAPANALLLIDTPGYSARMLQDLGGDLAAFLNSRQDIDTHLVLTASMRGEDLRNTADRFAIFGPSKLLFTKLDETTSLAAIFCEAARRQMPLSFFCQGQLIPEDLEPASKEKIAESLVRQLPEVLRAVA